MEEQRPNDKGNQSQQPARSMPIWLLLIVLGCLVFYMLAYLNSNQHSSISYSYFKNLIFGRDYNGVELEKDDGTLAGCMIDKVDIQGDTIVGIFKSSPTLYPEPTFNSKGDRIPAKKGDVLKKTFTVRLPDSDVARNELLELLTDQGVSNIDIKPPNDLIGYYTILIILFSLGLLLFMFLSLRRTQNQMMGGGGFLSNFSRSPAKKYEASAQPVSFKDVAGLEGVKADLQEIVEFLREPSKFQKLGGRVPKGVLLIGPPGTGKTLLARAVAGEAEVPYFSVNGSEFIQMFVGVGASRVRDLFATAKSQAPAIIFIDEIDAVGRQRGAGLGGGHDEREQTLNQILGEMDGFMGNDSVIVLAATNRPDILDPALLRPGRFDRHVTVSRPTVAGRLAIFKVHVRDVPLDKDVDLEVMAQATAGMTGADIQNLVNEAALWAARKDKNKVQMEDFYYAHDKVLMGAKREEVLSEKEKERTAYHEVGHTLAAWFLKGANPVHKVTIIPRGQALGVTQMVPDEDRMNMSENEIRDHLVVLLAGRAAEKLIYDELTVGAENDLERATSMARRMVTHWGMSDRLGPVSYKMTDDDPFLGREMQKSRTFSEHTMEVIDEEVMNILQNAAQKAIDLLNDHKANLENLTQELISQEELDRHEIEAIIGASVHKAKQITKEESSQDSGDGVENSEPTEASPAEENAEPTGS